MEHLGAPISIQNTDSGIWLVTCNHFVSGETASISFTVPLPRSNLSLPQIQAAALRKAVELLQEALKQYPEG